MTAGNQLPTSVPLPVLPAVEAAKRLAAYAAVDRHIAHEHKVSHFCVYSATGSYLTAHNNRSLVSDQDPLSPTSWTEYLLKGLKPIKTGFSFLPASSPKSLSLKLA